MSDRDSLWCGNSPPLFALNPHSILDLFFHLVSVNTSPSIEWQCWLVTLRWRQQFNGNRSTQITLVMKVPLSIHSWECLLPGLAFLRNLQPRRHAGLFPPSQCWSFKVTISPHSGSPFFLLSGMPSFFKWSSLSFSQQTMIILACVSQNILSAFYGKALLFCQKPIWIDSFPRMPWSASVIASSCPTPGYEGKCHSFFPWAHIHQHTVSPEKFISK